MVSFKMINAKLCCFIDPCDIGYFICQEPGTELYACNQGFKVKNDCYLDWERLDECCFADACSGEKICRFPGQEVRDSCGNIYSTDPRTCQLY